MENKSAHVDKVKVDDGNVLDGQASKGNMSSKAEDLQAKAPTATPSLGESDQSPATAGVTVDTMRFISHSDPDLNSRPTPLPLPNTQIDVQPGAYHGRSNSRLASVNYNSFSVATGTTEQQAPPYTVTPSNINQNTNTEGLVVANRVPEHERDLLATDTPEATALDPDEKMRDRRNYVAKLMLGLFLLLLIVIGVILLLVFAVGEEDDEETTHNVVNQTETQPLSLEDQLISLLPQWSVDAIREEESSSQYSALQWLLDDPELQNYTDARKVQRYALAAFFFGATGDTWKNASGWMDYNTHECQWYMSWISEFLNSELQHYPDLKGPCYSTDNPDDIPGETYRHLSLFDNDLQGSIPEEVYLLTSLKTIVFDFNPIFSGTLSTNIGTLNELEHLAISVSGLSGSIPSEIGLLSDSLSNLYFFNNVRLNSTLPSEIGLLKNIRYMGFFGDPLLHGSIPAEFVFPKAINLYLASNQLSGTIPPGLIASTGLKRLALRLNKLTGTIPSEFGLCTNLWQLVLDGNSLTGTVPPELGALAVDYGILQNLNLTDNGITGTIPSGLCLLDSPGWQNGTNPPGTIIESPIQIEHDCNENLCGCSCSCP